MNSDRIDVEAAATFLPHEARGSFLIYWDRLMRLGHYWKRRRDFIRGQQRRALEPMLGRRWRAFRRNYCGGPADGL